MEIPQSKPFTLLTSHKRTQISLWIAVSVKIEISLVDYKKKRLGETRNIYTPNRPLIEFCEGNIYGEDETNIS